MAKRKQSDAGSLDLLLDTICNTFGGILLIALLVIILLNTTSKSKESTPPSEESVADIIEKNIERGKLTRELEKLKKAADAQKEVQGEFVSVETIKKVEELGKLKKKRTEKVIEKSEVVGDLHQKQDDINTTAKETSVSNKELAEAEKKLKEMQTELEKKFEKKASEVAIPKVEKSYKPVVQYFLKDGKIYGPIDLLNGRENTAEFNFTNVSGTIRITAKQNAGTVIPDEFSDLTAISREFNGITPGKYIIEFFIWPDTFGRYDPILKATDAKKFKRSIHFVEEGAFVFRGPRSGPNEVS